MNKTGTAIVSVIVGAAIGYVAAKAIAPTCSANHYIQVDPNAPSNAPIDTCVYLDKESPIIWQSTDRSAITVEFGVPSPCPAAAPLDPNDPSLWVSGPLNRSEAQNTKSFEYKVKFKNGSSNIGHIIIR